MEHMITVRSEGSGDAGLLEKEILGLKDEFSKEGVEICREIRKSLKFGAVGVGAVVITIGAGIAINLITDFIRKVSKKSDGVKNVNTQINIQEFNVTFNFPEDKQKLLDYLKDKENE